MKVERKRIAIEVPIPIHEKIAKHCEERGLTMTQWVITLITKELYKK